MTELAIWVTRKAAQDAADNELVLAQQASLDQLRDAEAQRAARIDQALANGDEPPNQLPVDPQAVSSMALTSTPGMSKK